MSMYYHDEEDNFDETYEEGEEYQENVPVFAPEPDDAEYAKQASPAIDQRHDLASKILKQIHESLGNVIELLENGDTSDGLRELSTLVTNKKQLKQHIDDISGSRVVEGVFDGITMIGSDGKAYSIPPNYASKSRLVEGDVLKLTIKPDGSFMFKQIGPIERKRVVGTLAFDESSGGHVVLCGPETFKVLTASVTFFKGEPGDEAIILLPKSGGSVWAAVENIVKKV